MADNDYITIPRAQIRFSSPHANIDKEWGPYNSVDSALQAMPNLNVRKAGKKFGVVSTVGGVTTVEEYMFTKDNATDNDIVKLVLSSDDVTGTFDYTIGSTTSEKLSEAIGANKIITIGTYIASVGRVGTSSSGYYVVCYTDEDGVFHKIVHGTSTSSVGTETTKEFAEVETVNSTSELGLSGVIGGIKKYQGNTMLDLGGVSGSGTLGNVIKNLISLGTHVDADDTNNVFAIKNINNDPVGTITLSTAASGAAVLTFADNNNGSFVATLPNLRYDTTTQMLKMVDAGGSETNLIKLSNLQIKTVFDYNTYEGDAPTSVAQDAYAIGDLALVEKQDTTTTPATVSYELAVVQSVTAGTPNDTIQWQPLGSINNVSLNAKDITFTSNSGLESTNVRDALDEVNIIGNSDSDADLDIADENGKVALRLSGGDIKTKNFDSRNIKISVGDDDEADLDFSDDNGHVVLRVSGGHIKTKNFDSANVVGKVIKVLIYGNSWAGDAVSYAGAILDEVLNGDARVHIGFCYKGAGSLQDHYNNAVNNSSYDKFFYYDSDNGWVSESSVSFNDALHLEDWDIILLQQVSGSAGDENTYQPYLNDLIDIISSRANKPVKFGWILARDKYNSQNNYQLIDIWNDAKTIAQSLLNTTLIEFVIPTGTATENARTTSLDDLGIHLTHDGSHLQDGVPCLVEAYCFALSILNVYGFGNKSINGSKFIPEQTIQPNGSVIGVTSGNIVLAQKCAIFAFKNPFVITDIDNLDLETEYQHLKSLETTNTENTSSSES